MNEKMVTTNEIMASVNDLRTSISENQSSLQDLMSFLQENMVLREEFEERLNRTTEELKKEMTVQRIHILDVVDRKLTDLKMELLEKIHYLEKQIFCLGKNFVDLLAILRNKNILTLQEEKAVLPSDRLS